MKIWKIFDVNGQALFFREPPEKGFKRVIYIFYMNFWKMIGLNLLFILFCLPVITIPGAVAGLSFVALKMARDEHYNLWSDFITAFKSNFKQGAAYFLISAAAEALALFAVFYYVRNTPDDWLAGVPMVLACVFAVFIAIVSFYAWVMIVKVKLAFGAMLKNAALLCVGCPAQSVILLLFTAAMLFISVALFPLTIIIPICLTFSSLAVVGANLAYPKIEKFIIEPYYLERHENESANGSPQAPDDLA